MPLPIPLPNPQPTITPIGYRSLLGMQMPIWPGRPPVGGPLNPETGAPLEFFEPVKVRLVRTIPGAGKAGSKVDLEYQPHGAFYLLNKRGRICKTDALEGQDFVW